MAELTKKERLQPSLLDRLTDDEPDARQESREKRVLSPQRLRECVRRDLTWLFNTTNLDAMVSLAEFPEVSHSVVNYGMPDLAVTHFGGVAVLINTSTTLLSLALNPTSVTGGHSSTGTVTLSSPARGGGAVVSLTSSDATATVPSSVTVPAGAASATFRVRTSAVAASTQVTLSASYGGRTQTASVTVLPRHRQPDPH